MQESKLTDKHYQLLELIRRNKYEVSELAEKSGFSEKYVLDLIHKVSTVGPIGEIFTAELRKVDREIEERISRKTNLVRERLIRKLQEWVDSVQGGSQLDSKTKHKQLVDAINAMNKAMPYQVNIEQYNWKDGMTAEEAVNEFKRIKGLAGQFAIRRRISEFAATGAAEDAVLDGPISEAPKDSQDIILPAKPQTESLPHEQGSGEGDIRGEQVFSG